MISAREKTILTAVETTIGEGTVLHVRAERLSGRRRPRRDAMPAADFTVGPDGRGGFLLVDYARIPSGEEARHGTAEEATRWARRLLGWDRVGAFRVALRAIHGEPEKMVSQSEEEARQVERGAALVKAFAHRRPLRAPLFGGCGVKVVP